MQIFISHISEENPLALVMKDWLESSFPQIKVFVSSDPDDIPAGTKWLNKIGDALKDSTLLIILYSPQSTLRPWINFEAGCGWIKDIPIMPICHSGLKVSQLGAPISSFQSLDIGATDFTKDFFGAVTKLGKFKQAHPVSTEEFMRAVKDAIGSIKYKVIEGAPTETKNELSEEQIEIMRHLVEYKNAEEWGEIPGVSKLDLSMQCYMKTLIFNYHIQILIEKKYVDQGVINELGNSTPFYSITEEGIHYMISNGLYK